MFIHLQSLKILPGLSLVIDMRLIDADALKDAIMQEVYKDRVGVFVARRIFKLIDNAPTVELNDKSLEIARKSIELGRKVGKLEGKLEKTQGEWIYKRVDTQRCGNIHGCNICGQEVESFSTDYQNRPCSFNFCPNCGARMKNEKTVKEIKDNYAGL